MTSSSRSLFRLSALLAGAHFLLYHTMLGLFLVAPRERGSRNALSEAILFPLMTIFMLPASVLPFQERDASPFWFFPPGAAIPVAFCSLVWALVLSFVWFVIRRFIRYRPSAKLVRYARLVGSLFALFSITWLFFGPVSGFAGDLMFGILDAGRHMDGQFLFRPLWLIISGVLWGLTIFGAYKLIFVSPHRVSPAEA